MIKQISRNVWKFYFDNLGSNCYFVKTEKENLLIDTSGVENRKNLVKDLSNLTFMPIKTILLTHLHYDHIGNLSIFENAKAYLSMQEISDFHKNPLLTTLAEIPKNKIKSIKAMLKPISKFKSKYFEIIETPGHTRGSLCFYMPKEKILFSGDTLFEEGIGRTDLPTSNESKMEISLKRLRKLDYKILCAGH